MWFCRQVPQPDRPPSLSSLSRTETLSSSPSPHAHTSLGLAPAPIHAASQCSLLFLRGGPCPPLSSVPFAPPRGSRSQGARARRRRIGRQRRRWIWEWWSRRRPRSTLSRAPTFSPIRRSRTFSPIRGSGREGPRSPSGGWVGPCASARRRPPGPRPPRSSRPDMEVRPASSHASRPKP